MADRAFSTLIPRLSTSVPGCPTALMQSAVRDAAIYVCEQTLMWRYAEAPYNLSPGVCEYEYRKPTNADVHVVFTATVNGSPLYRLPLEQALIQYPDWVDNYSGVSPLEFWPEGGSLNGSMFNETTFAGGPGYAVPETAYTDGSEPRVFTQLTPDKFIIIPLPDDEKVYSLRLIYALKPKRSATYAPQTIVDELEDCIIHRALQELLVLPNQAWSDRELAAYHAKQSLFRITERRARANLGNMRGTLTVQMRPFM